MIIGLRSDLNNLPMRRLPWSVVALWQTVTCPRCSYRIMWCAATESWPTVSFALRLHLVIVTTSTIAELLFCSSIWFFGHNFPQGYNKPLDLLNVGGWQLAEEARGSSEVPSLTAAQLCQSFVDDKHRHLDIRLWDTWYAEPNWCSNSTHLRTLKLQLSKVLVTFEGSFRLQSCQRFTTPNCDTCTPFQIHRFPECLQSLFCRFSTEIILIMYTPKSITNHHISDSFH